MKSYLQDRTQYVQVAEKKSKDFGKEYPIQRIVKSAFFGLIQSLITST